MISELAAGKQAAIVVRRPDDAAQKRFTEESMKSLLDLADSYEEWAQARESTAGEILDYVACFAADIQALHRQRASKLTAEAAELRARAAELRAPYMAKHCVEWRAKARC